MSDTPAHADVPTPAPTTPPPAKSACWWAAVVLAGVALLLTGYLTYKSVTGGTPAGCGDGSGCAAVFGTKWSKWLGLPVSGLAGAVYVVVMATLVGRRRLGGPVLAAAAVAVLGAGAWFMYVQWFEVGAVCVWCTAGHAVGAVLAVTLLSATAGRHLLPGVVAGGVGVAALVGVQLTADDPVFLLDEGGGTRDGATLTLLDGRLDLNLADEMVLGDPESDRLLVKMFDYNCPHCRHAHDVTQDLPGVAVVLLPVPLNPDCNAYATRMPLEQFDHSCGLAEIALAVQRLDATQLEAFDRWVYGDGWPRTAAQAQAFAESLVDPALLRLELNDPELDEILRRNTEAWGRAREAELVGGLPVHLAPGRGLTYGGVGDGTGLIQLLDGTHHSQQPVPESENESAHDPPTREVSP